MTHAPKTKIPPAPLFQRGELNKIPLKVPLEKGGFKKHQWEGIFGKL
jgi:hypothetical protein